MCLVQSMTRGVQTIAEYGFAFGILVKIQLFSLHLLML